MPRRGLKIRTWDDVIDHLMDINARHMVRKDSKSPYLCVKDKITKKQVSLRPLIHFLIFSLFSFRELITCQIQPVIQILLKNIFHVSYSQMM